MEENLNYKKSIEMWIESQENYIEELESRFEFSQRDSLHFDQMVQHEKKVLSDYLKELSKKN